MLGSNVLVRKALSLLGSVSQNLTEKYQHGFHLAKRRFGGRFSHAETRSISSRVLQRCCRRGHTDLLFQEHRLRGNPHISGSFVLVVMSGPDLCSKVTLTAGPA